MLNCMRENKCIEEEWKKTCGKNSHFLDQCEEHVICIGFDGFEEVPYIYSGLFNFEKNDIELAKVIKKLNLEHFCYKSFAFDLIEDRVPPNADNHEYKTHLFYAMSYLYWAYGSPLKEDNFLKKYLEQSISTNIRRSIKNKYTNRVIKVRNGQNTFRKDLIDYYGCCQLCGLKNHEILIASHSKPFPESENDEAINFYNGLLLCPNHDKLYDKGLISFNDDGNILISSELSKTDKNILNLNSLKPLELEPEHIEFIQWHRDNIFRK